MNENLKETIRFNRGTSAVEAIASCAQRFLTLAVLLTGLITLPLFAADEAGITGKTKEAARDTSAAVEQAGTAAADTAKEFWQRVDEARLKNRTPDELVAWVIMGVLVGTVAGMRTTHKPTATGKVGRLVLGLAGAFLGGIIAHVGQFNFGWGPVLIRYEELFFSFVGAILIVAAGKIIRSRMKERPKPH
jgi:uncharacterized membrane protein YeaQ/YmgE (transglycosylase-associated protein family)